MSIKGLGVCAVCGEPATVAQYLDTAAAPPHGLSMQYTSDRKRPTRPLCEEHSPYDFGGKKEIKRLRALLQQISSMTFDGNVRELVDKELANVV